ncbi:Helix-turn-helix domain-containing protein [Salinihabitans flavidus]|uniref:Helix-turn-helix domain-containing protein n=1 Tax=Salinihabitans flavidus TaxID=569882 RepID=A0A1H8RMC5_9RHOB|nr:Helix-turn-helix domain-containing protein [Salinihabitans flavidus]
MVVARLAAMDDDLWLFRKVAFRLVQRSARRRAEAISSSHGCSAALRSVEPSGGCALSSQRMPSVMSCVRSRICTMVSMPPRFPMPKSLWPRMRKMCLHSCLPMSSSCQPWRLKKVGCGIDIRNWSSGCNACTLAYVQHLRVDHAKRKLEQSDLSVEQISWEVGYEDGAAFRRLFKRLARVTPGTYRRKFAPDRPT